MTNISTANLLLRWLITLLFIGGALTVGYVLFKRIGGIRDFEGCKAAGGFVQESSPAQCRINGEIFVEDIVR